MKQLFLGLALATALFGSAIAAESERLLQGQMRPTVSLDKVLDAVSHNEALLFAVDSTVAASVVVGQLDVRKIDYRQLLLVLRNNGLAAVRVDGVLNIVPVRTIRQAALPVLLEANDALSPEEWVTRVFPIQHAAAKMMVPILRPMLPQQGHLVAHVDSNTLVMVDRYGNTERIAKLLEQLDVQVQQQD